MCAILDQLPAAATAFRQFNGLTPYLSLILATLQVHFVLVDTKHRSSCVKA